MLDTTIFASNSSCKSNWTAHCTIFKFMSLNHFSIALAAYVGSLSSWKVNFCPSILQRETGSLQHTLTGKTVHMQLLCSSFYTWISTFCHKHPLVCDWVAFLPRLLSALPSILTGYLIPPDEKNPRNMMLPQPRFTRGRVFWGQT